MSKKGISTARGGVQSGEINLVWGRPGMAPGESSIFNGAGFQQERRWWLESNAPK